MRAASSCGYIGSASTSRAAEKSAQESRMSPARRGACTRRTSLPMIRPIASAIVMACSSGSGIVPSPARESMAAAGTSSGVLRAQAPAAVKGAKYSQVSPGDLKEWLTYLASDQLTGRQIYTEGYGLAAGYIQENLRKWGVKPLGENGTYLQTVKNRGYKVTRNSTVTVEVGGQTKTFKHGDHVTFAVNSGGKQTVAFTGVQFFGTSSSPVADRKSTRLNSSHMSESRMPSSA